MRMTNIVRATRKTIYDSNRSALKDMFKIEMATSKTFEADLPELTPEQLTKLYAWGQSSCEHLDVRMKPDMTMVLVATRKKAGSVRDNMRLLRTNLLNWGVVLPTKQLGWLRLITDKGKSAQKDGGDKEAADAPSNEIRNMPHASYCSVITLPPNLLTIPIASH